MKKQLLSIMMATSMCLSLTGCGNKDNTSTNEQPKTSKQEEKFYYESLDVNDFDPSKFDGTIKFNFDDSFKELKAPFTFSQIEEAGYFIKKDDLDMEALNSLTSESSDWAKSFALYYNSSKQEDGLGYTKDLWVPTIKEDGLTYQQILDEGTFILYCENDFLEELIHVNINKGLIEEIQDVVAVLGDPSMILSDYMNYEDQSSGDFAYIYKYDNFSLIFSTLEYTGDAGSSEFYEFYYASNDKALDAYLSFMEECDFSIVAQ